MTFLEPVMPSPEHPWPVMSGGGRIILVFASNTMVLNAEDWLDEAGLPFELIPVPKEVNPNCGLAISFKEEDGPMIMAALSRAGLKPETVYRRTQGDFQPWPDGFKTDDSVKTEEKIKVM